MSVSAACANSRLSSLAGTGTINREIFVVAWLSSIIVFRMAVSLKAFEGVF